MKRRRRIENVLADNARVRIYRRTRTVAGHKYLAYEVCDYTSGHRQLRGFADHQAARKEARRLAGWLAKGDAVAAAVSGREAAGFACCLELPRSVGDPPELACARYAEAVGILGNGSLHALHCHPVPPGAPSGHAAANHPGRDRCRNDRAATQGQCQRPLPGRPALSLSLFHPDLHRPSGQYHDFRLPTVPRHRAELHLSHAGSALGVLEKPPERVSSHWSLLVACGVVSVLFPNDSKGNRCS